MHGSRAARIKKHYIMNSNELLVRAMSAEKKEFGRLKPDDSAATAQVSLPAGDDPVDLSLAEHAAKGDKGAFERLMWRCRRHHQRPLHHSRRSCRCWHHVHCLGWRLHFQAYQNFRSGLELSFASAPESAAAS